MANKIYTNHTLEEYNKKYGNKKLKKVSKADVTKNKSLLNGHSWWLIKDTYYQLPDNKGFKVWWSNLGKGGRIAICALLGCTVAAAVVVPTVMLLNNKTVDHKAVIDPEVKDVTCTQKKLDNGALEVTLTIPETKEISSLEIYMGNEKLILGTDYTLNGSKIVIAADVLGRNKTKEITIKPKLKDKKIVYVTGITIDAPKTEIEVGDTLQFTADVKPTDATDKNVEWQLNFPQVNDRELATIDEKGLLTAKSAGDVHVFAVAKDGSEVQSDPFELVIKAKEVLVTSVEITNTTTEVMVDGKLELTTKILPEDASNKELDWSTSGAGSGKAHVDVDAESGVPYLIGDSAGVVTVTAAARDGSGKSASKDFTVKAQETEKEKFLRLYKPYNDAFQNATTVYDATDVTVTYGGKTEPATSILYNEKTELVARRCIINDDPCIAGGIQFEIGAISKLLDDCEGKGYEIKCYEDEINKTVSVDVINSGSAIFAYTFNSYGYLVKNVQGTMITTYSYTGEPHQPVKPIKTIPVEYDESSIQLAGLTLSNQGTELTEDTPVSFRLKNDTDKKITFDIVATVSGKVVYKNEGCVLNPNAYNDFDVDSESISGFGSLTKTDTILFAVETKTTFSLTEMDEEYKSEVLSLSKEIKYTFKAKPTEDVELYQFYISDKDETKLYKIDKFSANIENDYWKIDEDGSCIFDDGASYEGCKVNAGKEFIVNIVLKEDAPDVFVHLTKGAA